MIIEIRDTGVKIKNLPELPEVIVFKILLKVRCKCEVKRLKLQVWILRVVKLRVRDA